MLPHSAVNEYAAFDIPKEIATAHAQNAIQSRGDRPVATLEGVPMAAECLEHLENRSQVGHLEVVDPVDLGQLLKHFVDLLNPMNYLGQRCQLHLLEINQRIFHPLMSPMSIVGLTSLLPPLILPNRQHLLGRTNRQYQTHVPKEVHLGYLRRSPHHTLGRLEVVRNLPKATGTDVGKDNLKRR
ncbi:hypothetical protein ISCGN_008898 [Ixodes scapularis]